MSTRNDPLASAAQVAFAEELSSSMRHATRNKLAVIRNAVTYIHRRLGPTEQWSADPRIEMFYKMLESELEDASDLLEPRGLMTHVFVRDVRAVDAVPCVRMAVDTALVPTGTTIRTEIDPGTVNVDARELALALRCLVENAADVGSPIVVRGRSSDSAYLAQVADSGGAAVPCDFEQMIQPFFTTKDGHVGLGLNVARRIAYRYVGDLTLERGERGGVVASVRVPLAGEEEP